jgi:thiol-disulfide isomerase/thioredoxin
VGYFDYPTFSKECHWDHYVDEKFEPKGRWADSLKTLHVTDSLQMQIFLGCYCGDSKKYVPRFFKMEPALPIAQIDIISVDTTKKDEKNIGGMVGLKKIPTFIFYRDSIEIGRIVEKPKGGLEKNLFRLLKKCE